VITVGAEKVGSRAYFCNLLPQDVAKNGGREEETKTSGGEEIPPFYGFLKLKEMARPKKKQLIVCKKDCLKGET